MKMAKKKRNEKVGNSAKGAGNSSKVKATLATAVTIIAGLAFLKISSLFIPERGAGAFYMSVAKDFLAIGGCILAVLVLYSQFVSYFEVPSKFTLSLALFVSALALFTISSSRSILGFLGIDTGYGVFSVVPLAFSVAATALLAYVTQ